MTAFARKVLAGLPDTTVAGQRPTTTRTLQEFTADSDKAGGKIDLQATPDAVDVRPLRLPQPDDRSTSRTSRCRRAAPATAHIYARNRQFVLGATWVPSGDVAARSALRLFVDAGGQEPAGARDRRARSSSSACPGCRPIRASPAACRRRSSRGYSDLGRQATNPQWQYPTVYNPKVNYTWTRKSHSFKTGYEFQHIDTEVQDVNPLYGRDTYNGQFTPAGRRGGEQPLQPRRLHARPARAVRAQQRARRGPAPQHALRLPAGRLARRRAS